MPTEFLVTFISFRSLVVQLYITSCLLGLVGGGVFRPDVQFDCSQVKQIVGYCGGELSEAGIVVEVMAWEEEKYLKQRVRVRRELNLAS